MAALGSQELADQNERGRRLHDRVGLADRKEILLWIKVFFGALAMIAGVTVICVWFFLCIHFGTEFVDWVAG